MNFRFPLLATALVHAMGAWTGFATGAAAVGPPVLPIEVIDVDTGATAKLEPGAKVLHLVVFATWCRPCEDEIPFLAEWEARFGAEGYRLAIVATSRRQTRERLLVFARDSRPPGRLYLDASGSLERAIGVDGVPAHYLLDGEGRIRMRAGSLAEIDTAELEGLLGKPPRGPQGSR